jgi:type II secretory pathway component GspD/PulD (secretin)
MKKVILLISLIFSTLSSEPFFQLVESQTIEVFLENASVFLDKHIDTEKIDFKNLKITLVKEVKLDSDEVIPLVNAVLELRHMTLVNRGEYYEVVYSVPITCSALLVSNQENNSSMLTKKFEIIATDLKKLKNKLKPLIPKKGKLLITNENELTITAYPSTLKTIEYILKKRGCSFRELEVLNP